MTPHNEAKKEDIAKIVLMPGDPLRAKFIAENYLENYRLVNSVRNMLAYTGKYKQKEVTVMASGMGMPSMGLYCYELYKFYDVDVIIRIGSCGAYIEELNVFDLILVDQTYTEGNFALTYNNQDVHIAKADEGVNQAIQKVAKERGDKYMKGTTLCGDAFDLYIKDISKLFERIPKDLKIIGAEMEAFSLFYVAKDLGKKAACLLTVVDSYSNKKSVTAEEREKSLDTMITLALESVGTFPS